MALLKRRHHPDLFRMALQRIIFKPYRLLYAAMFRRLSVLCREGVDIAAVRLELTLVYAATVRRNRSGLSSVTQNSHRVVKMQLRTNHVSSKKTARSQFTTRPILSKSCS
jgi:hypothetical protein